MTVWYAVSRGQDFNWDQQNYHIGVPVLLAAGTFWQSIAPATIQSYFNPYLYQAQYWALRHLGPLEFVVALALAQSLAFVLAGRICADVVAEHRGGWRETMLALLGFSLCVAAPVSLSEAGTTLIELLLAVPVLAAYSLLLNRGALLNVTASGLLAGALLGLATALKLTNGVFALGTVGFMLAGPEPLKQRVRLVAFCGVAAVAAFLAVGGFWHLELFRRFGNPVFPYYNSLFRSPDFPPISLTDDRFRPNSVADIWAYPIYWLLGRSPSLATATPSTELRFVDARWVIAIFGLSLYIILLLIFRRWRRERLAERATGLCFAFLIGYLIWLAAFGIHRYLIPLDIACGAVILALTWHLRPYLLRSVLVTAFVVTSWRMMRVPDWGHVAWRSHWQAINPTQPDWNGPSLVFLTSQPLLFVAASLPPSAAYVGLGGAIDLNATAHTGLTRQIEATLAAAEPGFHIKEVDTGSVPDNALAVMASYGLLPSDRCASLIIANRTLRVCSLKRLR